MVRVVAGERLRTRTSFVDETLPYPTLPYPALPYLIYFGDRRKVVRGTRYASDHQMARSE